MSHKNADKQESIKKLKNGANDIWASFHYKHADKKRTQVMIG